jgi:hypothetical protein
MHGKDDFFEQLNRLEHKINKNHSSTHVDPKILYTQLVDSSRRIWVISSDGHTVRDMMWCDVRENLVTTMSDFIQHTIFEKTFSSKTRLSKNFEPTHPRKTASILRDSHKSVCHYNTLNEQWQAKAAQCPREFNSHNHQKYCVLSPLYLSALTHASVSFISHSIQLLDRVLMALTIKLEAGQNSLHSQSLLVLGYITLILALKSYQTGNDVGTFAPDHEWTEYIRDCIQGIVEQYGTAIKDDFLHLGWGTLQIEKPVRVSRSSSLQQPPFKKEQKSVRENMAMSEFFRLDKLELIVLQMIRFNTLESLSSVLNQFHPMLISNYIASFSEHGFEEESRMHSLFAIEGDSKVARHCESHCLDLNRCCSKKERKDSDRARIGPSQPLSVDRIPSSGFTPIFSPLSSSPLDGSLLSSSSFSFGSSLSSSSLSSSASTVDMYSSCDSLNSPYIYSPTAFHPLVQKSDYSVGLGSILSSRSDSVDGMMNVHLVDEPQEPSGRLKKRSWSSLGDNTSPRKSLATLKPVRLGTPGYVLHSRDSLSTLPVAKRKCGARFETQESNHQSLQHFVSPTFQNQTSQTNQPRSTRIEKNDFSCCALPTVETFKASAVIRDFHFELTKSVLALPQYLTFNESEISVALSIWSLALHTIDQFHSESENNHSDDRQADHQNASQSCDHPTIYFSNYFKNMLVWMNMSHESLLPVLTFVYFAAIRSRKESSATCKSSSEENSILRIMQLHLDLKTQPAAGESHAQRQTANPKSEIKIQNLIIRFILSHPAKPAQNAS